MERIRETDKRLFGEYAVLYAGFSKQERQRLIEFSRSHSKNLKVLFSCLGDTDRVVEDIFRGDDGRCLDENTDYPKTVIMSGFSEKELLEFLKKFKGLDIPVQLVAVLTETSKDWLFKDLIEELKKESEEIRKRKAQSNHKNQSS
ncbi:DUF3783 domain-containing protein [Hippea maritima]|uniref:DUF3783 domain-containing protein n=1 Tax=Hippea maritima (strain ATCC 700847 / DSM 10411 / MH2) TaxID=760142 RepID=F2LY06_HIPMA|nr:DUF3783 domain-containing protein [Hippea maritima]AEA33271.1 hypothetical protein Hipma_0294 [Hippea maritima DSM 10411]